MTVLRLGLTKVEIRGAELDVRITHNGNMGNTIERSVRPNVDKLLGEGTFDRMRSDVDAKEYGSPDYVYQLVAPIETILK